MFFIFFPREQHTFEKYIYIYVSQIWNTNQPWVWMPNSIAPQDSFWFFLKFLNHSSKNILFLIVHIWCHIDTFPITKNGHRMRTKASPTMETTTPPNTDIIPWYLLQIFWRQEYLGKFCCVKGRCVCFRAC